MRRGRFSERILGNIPSKRVDSRIVILQWLLGDCLFLDQQLSSLIPYFGINFSQRNDEFRRAWTPEVN
eukprot:542849-Amphidinium_carterae.1